MRHTPILVFKVLVADFLAINFLFVDLRGFTQNGLIQS